ncbi:MAG TPA: class I adenylate-forming enzyme family protein [Chthoniobacterales bacterium]|nr:class I adenylate-forming enzyme family protein [Chthoniobacterales bacterium]
MDILTIIRQKSETQPGQTAFSGAGKGDSITYRDLIARADKVAAELHQRGCRKSERCGLIMADGAEFLVSALGILGAGLCLVPIATFLPDEEKDFVIKAAGLHWLFQQDGGLFRLPFAQPVDDQDDEEFRACNPAYIRFTSGTTGRRKGILLGQEAIIDRLNCANTVLQIDSADRIWFALPMADHFIVSILLYLSRGATVLGLPKLENWCTTAQRYRPTVAYGSPDFYQALTDSDVGALDSLRLAISTTAPLPPQLAVNFARRFNKNLNPALGVIEVGLLTINTRPDKIGSVGRPMPAYAVTLVGEDGKPVKPGEVGELQVEGPGLLNAYLAPWRPFKLLLKPYGYPTGDFAWVDPDGYLFLAGREKNRLQISGVQFFCEEVESILNTLPGVEESRVFLDSTSQTLSAEVVGSPGPTEQLTELLLQRIDSRKVPRRFQIVEHLPRTPNGKLRRG